MYSVFNVIILNYELTKQVNRMYHNLYISQNETRAHSQWDAHGVYGWLWDDGFVLD